MKKISNMLGHVKILVGVQDLSWLVCIRSSLFGLGYAYGNRAFAWNRLGVWSGYVITSSEQLM